MEDFLIESLSKFQDFFVARCLLLANNIDEGLDCPCAVDIGRDLSYLWEHSTDELLQAVDGAHFYQFLAEIVSKLIGHHVWQNAQQILKNILHERT